MSARLLLSCSALAFGFMLAAPLPAAAREVVAFADTRFQPGTIVVRTAERRL